VPQWASEHSRGGSFNPAFRGRWPESQSRTVRWLVHWVDDIAGSFYRITFLVVAWLALAITTGLGIGELYQFIEPLRVEDPDFLSNLLVTIAEIGWFIAALTAVTVALLSLIAFLAASFGLRAVRRVGYGLVRTYVAGTGAPPWSGYATNEHVIRLPIGHCVTTLSFDMKDEQREAVQNDALVTTREALRQVLAEPPSRGLPGEIT
jgi:hypothetical protein